MTIDILDVLFIRDVWLGNCPDARPCVVIGKSHGHVCVVMLVSGAYDLRRANLDFNISDYYPAFKQTGLSKPSFVLGDEIHEIDDRQIIKKLGKLEGLLAADFKLWLGI